jgi:hypothetical protein
MSEPRIGPTERIVIHQAAGVPPPTLASRPRMPSASSTIGCVDESAMMTTTNIGSV